MYNSKFNVKYNDIETELIEKLKNKSKEEYEENSDEEYEYSSQDVLEICNKLYRDEFLSVFGAEDLSDEKIDKGMDFVYNIMVSNIKFKDIIDEFQNIFFMDYFKKEEYSKENEKSLRQLILLTLFSQNIFYLTHKCICQQIEFGTIEEKLLINLRKHTIDLIKNQFELK